MHLQPLQDHQLQNSAVETVLAKALAVASLLTEAHLPWGPSSIRNALFVPNAEVTSAVVSMRTMAMPSTTRIACVNINRNICRRRKKLNFHVVVEVQGQVWAVERFASLALVAPMRLVLNSTVAASAAPSARVTSVVASVRKVDLPTVVLNVCGHESTHWSCGPKFMNHSGFNNYIIII